MNKMICTGNDSLRTEDDAVLGFILKGRKDRLHLRIRIHARSLASPAGEDLIGVMVVMMVMVVIVASAVAVLVMIVMMMFVFVVMIVASAVAGLIVVMVMMLVFVVMIVAAAIAVLIMVMVMMLVVVIVASAVAVLIMIVMMMLMLMMLVCLMCEMRKLVRKRGFLLHGGEDLRTSKCVPIGRNKNSIGIMLAEKLDACGNFVFRHSRRMAEDNASGMLHLIVEKLAEILHVHTALFRVYNGDRGIQLHFVRSDRLNRTDDVAQLANTRRLDQNALGRVFFNDLRKRTAEIADKAATDTTGVHLGRLDARLSKKCAVHADLAKFVLDQNDLFFIICLGDQLFDQCRLACAEKSGKNIDLRLLHTCTSLSTNRRAHILRMILYLIIIPLSCTDYKRILPKSGISRRFCKKEDG